MSEADLRANALRRSADCAARDAMIDGEVARLVALKVEAQLKLFTTEEKTRFLEALEEHGNVHRACQAVGISRRTANVAREKDPLFADAWSEILEGRIDRVEGVLYEQCLDPSSANTVARIFYLKSARRDRYGEHVRVDHGHTVELEVVLLTPAQSRRLASGVVEAEVVDAETLGEPLGE